MNVVCVCVLCVCVIVLPFNRQVTCSWCSLLHFSPTGAGLAPAACDPEKDSAGWEDGWIDASGLKNEVSNASVFFQFQQTLHSAGCDWAGACSCCY